MEIQLGSRPCECREKDHQTRLVALTGGPGAGKTAVIEMALRSLCSHVGALPEAAGLVFGGGFPRHQSGAGRHAVQRAIFHVQRELERLVVGEGQLAMALCDRGTVDGAAYWPEGYGSYWDSFQTTREEQLARYAAVIHLRTPSLENGYNRENALRVESVREAKAIDERILEAWEGHPNRFVVNSTDDFFSKAGVALKHVRAQVPRCCHTDPQDTDRPG